MYLEDNIKVLSIKEPRASYKKIRFNKIIKNNKVLWLVY